MQGEYELLQTPLQSVVCIRTPLCTFYDTAKQLITEFQVKVWELSPYVYEGKTTFTFIILNDCAEQDQFDRDDADVGRGKRAAQPTSFEVFIIS